MFKKIMIKYKYFKYIFFGYCIYNILYSLVFMFVPILFYAALVIRISLRIKNQSIINLNEIITPGLNNLKDYTILFPYSNNVDNMLIILLFILFFICYVFVKKCIIHRLLLNQYEKIVIIIKKQFIPLSKIILFSCIDFVFTIPTSTYICLMSRILYTHSIKYFYIIQIINYSVSCVLVYFLLNKLLECYIRVRFNKIKV